ncbi:ribosomal protein S6 modification protein [Aquisalinus flavus]|uniref:Ribosomal protein S6 modification protein n=1 Tax=Aquisalinus flavus TaxID=1526572 RepID=A0A8J2V4U1_9PROT|nr:ATP-dependent zinc protease [Aquisalinus flavus]GGD04134.1 ribosomal protein S6 modification protein [Aquisalinus flavus]
MKKAPAKTLGWREWIGLPAFGIDRMKAKIDTGAKTSAIHAYKVREFDRDGALFVSFYIHPVQRKKKPEIYCEAPVADRRAVRSSNGKEEIRYVIRTELQIGSDVWPAEFTLTNRDQMGFRALVGREALRKRYLIDPSRSFVQKQKTEQ